MAYLDPQEAFEHFSSKVVESVRQQFPVKGRVQTLSLEKIDVRDTLHPDDIRSQQRAKSDGSSWAVPMFGTFVLKDNLSGKTVEKRTVRIADIPKMTKRYSYIVSGQEYQVDSQWQLKPGAYARHSQVGELKVQFNCTGPGSKSFNMLFNPEKRQFQVRWNKANIPAYPILSSMGVTDEQMQKAWGKDILEASKKARGVDGALANAFRSDRGRNPTSEEEAKEHMWNTLQASQMDADATRRTLGRAYESVTGAALLTATQRILSMHQGEPEDDRDSLIFKRLRGVGDYAQDKIGGQAWQIRNKMLRKVDNATAIRDIVKSEHFNAPIVQTFHKNQAARVASQINPLEMISGNMQTTVRGPGGIQSEHGVVDETKFINASHFGFLDPINTPEGPTSGVSLRLPIGIRKVGDEPRIPLYNLKTHKMELVNPATLVEASLLLPDQVTWKDGRPQPVGPKVKMLAAGNDLTIGKFSDADYVMRHPAQIFNITSNMIPFLHNTNGNRAGMAARHFEQAISLEHREVPLVQVATGADTGPQTFEEMIGRQTSHVSDVAGKVTAIKRDGIIVQAADGKKHEIQLYDHYPLNEPKALLHSTPRVAVGDTVRKGQHVADTNFTRDGALALGTNLRVAYMPYKGYNFDDGIVISESASKRMSSVHLAKPSMMSDAQMSFDPGKFRVLHPGTYKTEQYEKIGSDGIVRVGQRVKPGDPLVLATTPFQLQDRVGIAAIRKSLSGVHTDKSLKWESEHEGEVVGTHRKGDAVYVHVKTVEPMGAGDKMCYDEQTEMLTATGWKPVESVTLRDRVCCLVDGKVQYDLPTETHAYTHGGSMYRIETQQVDLFVTIKHQMYVQPRGAAQHGLYPAHDIVGKRVRYKKDGSWAGAPLGDVVFPALEAAAGQLFGNGTRYLPELRFPSKIFLMLLGLFLSEGSTFGQPDGRCGIGITQIKEPGRSEITAALDAAGIAHDARRDGTRFRIYSKQLFLYFQQFNQAKDKYIPLALFDATREELKILFDWLVWGGGGHVHGTSIRYTTASKRLADDVQRLCLHIGWAADVRHTTDNWRIIGGQRCLCADRHVVKVVTTKLTLQVNHGHVTKQNAQKEYIVDAYDGPVYCVTVPSHVVYVRRNGKAVWSGNSGRYGNKGIISMVLPDSEMPRSKDGHHIEVLLNPIGVPSRINVGQIFETVAGKIAQKTGKPYVVRNFEPGVDQLARLKQQAKQHGVSDTEELFDPQTGLSFGHIQTGPQYMTKQVHQVEKKGAVRSGMTVPGSRPEHYDNNLVPSGGGHTGGQSIGSLGLYALLAHGAKANIREMQTWKSEGADPQTNEAKKWKSQHTEVWKAIQNGTPLPPPTPTFAFKKFTDYLKAAGINMEKQGHTFVLSPLTDRQIEHMSSGALPHPDQKLSYKINAKKELLPKAGGLFDERFTGGHGGTKWSHINLAEPVPNPVFEGPIKSLTGLKQKEFDALMAGRMAVTPKGELTADTKQGLVGGAAIQQLLKHIDVEQGLKAARRDLDAALPAKVDVALKRVKYLEALRRTGMAPHEAYILHKLPVIPPVMRPITFLPNGTNNEADLNGLYSEFGQINKQLGDPIIRKEMIDARKEALRTQYYDGVRAIMGVGVPYGDQKQKGLLHQIAGASPKEGYFQKTLMHRRQDLTLRGTIIPEPALGLDEVGVPRQYAMDLFRPFVVRQLQLMGVHAISGPSGPGAQELIAQNNPLAQKMLERVMRDKPVLLKRDPVLHKYGIMGFKPKLVDGSAIRVHPLVTGGFNADFDGDAMSMYVPITREAEAEAHKMMPSNNLFANASGKVMFQPKFESALGLYKLTRVTGQSTKKFADPGQAVVAARDGKLELTHLIDVKGVGKTTAGRILVAAAMPKTMQHRVLTDQSLVLNKKGLDGLLSDMAHLSMKGGVDKDCYAKHVNLLKDVGNGAATGLAPIIHDQQPGGNALDPKQHAYVKMGAHTLNLSDLEPDRHVRDYEIRKGQLKVDAINKMQVSAAEKERRTIDVWTAADRSMQAAHNMRVEAGGRPSNLYMLRAVGKPSDDQYKQLILAPMLVKDTRGRTIPIPITKSFTEGQDVSDYWIGMYGARRGVVRKVQEVQEPGVITKMMQNTAMDTVIAGHDCGTDKGIALSVNDKAVHDRHLAAAFREGKLHVPAGTMLSPDVIGQIKAVKKDAQLLVRSPLKCQHEHGICQKCMGLSADGRHYDIGYNVGVEAAHAHGERTTQLMLNSFHCMHEHSIVLARDNGVVLHTTLGKLHARYGSSSPENLFVWDRDRWSKVTQVQAHVQKPGTTMVMCRTRSGHFIVSQDNHPHMLRSNQAVCPVCGRYPKRSNGGRQHYCRKCGYRWDGAIPDDAHVAMVCPEEMAPKSHRAAVTAGPQPTPQCFELDMQPWLAGMFCAEGCIHCVTDRCYTDEPTGVTWTQNQGTDIYDKLWASVGRFAGNVGLPFSRCGKSIVLHSVALGQQFMQLFGRYSRNKGLPDGWSGYNNDWLLQFVAGVMDGDGTFVTTEDSKWPVAKIDTTSVLLAQQVHWILRANGIPAHVMLTKMRKLSRHQGLAVTFVVTEKVKALLSDSLKIQSIACAKPTANEERFADVVDYLELFFFGSPPMVYDLTTETGTLSVNSFWTHNTGGVAGTKKGAGDEFEAFERLVKLPESIPDQAAIAVKTGKIDNIRHDKLGAWMTIGGHEHFVGKDRNGAGLHEDLPYAKERTDHIPWQIPHVGMQVQAGQFLSDPNRTVINPRQLYEATNNIDAVQNHLTKEIHGIFGKEGLNRRQSELLVKTMTNTTKVTHAGDHPEVMRGEYRNASWVKAQNALLQQQGKRPITHQPELKGIDVMPLTMREDWMAKLQHQHLRTTILEAAATGGVSDLHGTHPVPGIAYGVEFGYNQTIATRPGYEKYKDVPAHHY